LTSGKKASTEPSGAVHNPTRARVFEVSAGDASARQSSSAVKGYGELIASLEDQDGNVIGLAQQPG
jgi:hypothetical protein